MKRMRIELPKKSRKSIIISCVIIIIMTLSIITISNPSASANTYTKNELREIVVGTALSYLNKNTYSDYGQTSMDIVPANLSATFNWRDFSNSPEDVSRSNYFNIDCTSFVSLVYQQALGYDFSEYYKYSKNYTNNIATQNYYAGGKYHKTVASTTNFINAYKYYGKGYGAGYFHGLASELLNYSGEGTIWKNDSASNKLPVAFYYKTTASTTDEATEKAKVLPYLTNVNNGGILRVGDIIVYQTKKSGIKNGHALLYVGNYMGETATKKEGVIHSSGLDYKIEKETISNGSSIEIGKMTEIGDDQYSIRYNNMQTVLNNIFNNDGQTLQITVIRPLNRLCDTNGNCTLELPSNSKARIDLSKLQTEQYTSILKSYTDNLTSNTATSNTVGKTLSDRNSVNKGDTIQYNLLLKNKSKHGYCSSHKPITHPTEEKCENAKDTNGNNLGYTWITVGKSATKYKDLVIKAQVPTNTTYVKNSAKVICKNNDNEVTCASTCTIDSSNKNITCNINTEIGENDSQLISYKVKVNESTTSTKITNNGMTIKTPASSADIIGLGYSSHASSGNNTLQLGKMTVNVNPTLNNININLINKRIDEFQTLFNNGKITFSDSQTNNHAQNMEKMPTGSIAISQAEFVKMIYYNEFGLDLGFLTKDNIKNAVFNKLTSIENTNGDSVSVSNFYTKKTNSEVSDLTNSNYKLINQMLVNGMYGGRLLHGNDNKDRASYIRFSSLETMNSDSTSTKLDKEHDFTSDFEYGDLIFVFYGTRKSGEDYTARANNMRTYLYTGLDKYGVPTLKQFTKNGVIEPKHTEGTKYPKRENVRVLQDIYANDLFVVIRPMQYYGTTVNYEYNGGKYLGDNYVTKGTYRNLVTPTKDPYKVTYSYNKTTSSLKCSSTTCPTSLTSANNFEGWYKDSTLTTKVTNATSLASSTAHTLYAKWTPSSQTLPQPTLTGYSFGGWYSDKNLTNKVTSSSNNYTPTSNTTLYGKWGANTYKIEYVLNGGKSGTSAPESATYDSVVTISNPTKEGSTFNGWTSTTINNSTAYYDSTLWKDKTTKVTATSFKNLTPTNDATVTLIANWTENEEEKTYTVKYKVEGNATINGNDTETVLHGNSPKGVSITNEQGQAIKIIWKADKDVTLINGTKITAGNLITQDELITIKVTEDITLTAILDIESYKVTYKSDENGKITGRTTEEVLSNKNPTGTTVSSNEGYKLINWISNKKVTLKNGTQIPAGESITNNQILEIVITEDITLTSIHKINIYTVTYKSDSNGIISGNSSEMIEYGKSPTVPITTPNKGYEFKNWTADKDIILQDGTKITAGNKISSEQASQIKVTQDITLTVNHVLKTFTITYESDEYGTITGITTETKNYGNNPSGTTVSPKEDYKILKWTVDKDVKLVDGTIFTAGVSLTEEQVKQIIIEDNLTIKVHHYKNKYTINYQSDISDLFENNKVEEVAENQSPFGVTVKKGYTIKSYSADKDVTLKTGEKITAKDEITPEQFRQIVVTENLNITVLAVVTEYKVIYSADQNGKITGKKEENIKYKSSPTGTKVTANKGYEFIRWIANKDVTLKTGEIIKAGNKITPEQLKQISVEEELVLTSIFAQKLYTISYKNGDTGVLFEKEKEQLLYGSSPTGVVFKSTEGLQNLKWIANKDVKLTNGQIIKSGEYITSAQLKQIVVEDDLILTLVDTSKKVIQVPDTGTETSKIITVIGFVFIIAGVYLITNKKKLNK